MQLNTQALALVVAAVAVPGAVAQKAVVVDPGDPGVSMVVTTTRGTFGYECEPFVAQAHVADVPPGEGVIIDIYALAEMPYLLAAGMPSTAAYNLPCCQAQLVMEPPILLVEVGVVAPVAPGPCGMDRVYTKLQIPDAAPIGAQLVLQGLAFRLADDRPAFTRPVLLNVF